MNRSQAPHTVSTRSASKFNPKGGAILAKPLTLLFLAALLVRQIYLAQVARSPLFFSPVGNALGFVEDAVSLLESGWLAGQIYFYNPLYQYFLSVLFAIFGSDLYLVRLVQVIMGASLCVLIGWVGTRLFSLSSGSLAGIMALLYGPFLFFEAQLLPATLSLLLSFLSITLIVAWQTHRQSALLSFGSGLCLGLASLGRPNLLLCALVVLVWILPRTRKWTGSGMYVLGVLLAVLPVTCRNYVVGKDVTLISSQGGINFFIGNNRYATGTFMIPKEEGVYTDTRGLYEKLTKEVAEKEAGRPLKLSEVSRHWWAKGWAYLFQSRKEALALWWKKLSILCNWYEYPTHHNYYFFKRYTFLSTVPFLSFLVVFPLGFAGMVLSHLNKKGSTLLTSFALVYGLTNIVFFVSSRYRIIIVPFMILYAAYFLVEAFHGVRLRKWARTCAAASLLAVGILLNHLPTGTPRNDFAFDLSHLAANAFQRGEFSRSLELYLQALPFSPSDSSLLNNIGLIYLLRGESSQAIPYFAEAVAREPRNVKARENLHVALTRSKHVKGGETVKAHTVLQALPPPSEPAQPRPDGTNILSPQVPPGRAQREP
jgi:4-amino-4-deoxy-L-arabinose transferase-like glycosyltransferase